MTVRRAIPVVTDACYTVGADNAVEARITGYSTTRQLTKADFTFAGSGNTAQQNASVDLTGTSVEYFGSDDSVRNGGAFTLSIPFTLQGAPVGTASMTLGNSLGSTATRQLNRCP
jgi:hypothetical protein